MNKNACNILGAICKPLGQLKGEPIEKKVTKGTHYFHSSGSDKQCAEQ